MNRGNACILINSTPRYFDVLRLQVLMMRRYSPEMRWPIFLATEVPDHPIVLELEKEFGIQVLPLEASESGFLECRLASLEKLPFNFQVVLPLQEDFLLDRPASFADLEQALSILEEDDSVSSLRLMPCPGPSSDDLDYSLKPWKILGHDDFYWFTFQATLWRRKPLLAYFQELLAEIGLKFPTATTPAEKKRIALDMNAAESDFGQSLLRQLSGDQLHLAWPRAGEWPNAVYLCPWPYRPTAVVKGKLMDFARELFKREGLPAPSL
jgi:hypothetical protein